MVTKLLMYQLSPVFGAAPGELGALGVAERTSAARLLMKFLSKLESQRFNRYIIIGMITLACLFPIMAYLRRQNVRERCTRGRNCTKLGNSGERLQCNLIGEQRARSTSKFLHRVSCEGVSGDLGSAVRVVSAVRHQLVPDQILVPLERRK